MKNDKRTDLTHLPPSTPEEIRAMARNAGLDLPDELMRQFIEAWPAYEAMIRRIPRSRSYAEEPAHAKARDQFDAALAQVDVPAAAAHQHAALADYLRFANRIDAARAAAARRGQQAFDAEITHERTVDLTSSVITALEAAGFNESCTAR